MFDIISSKYFDKKFAKLTKNNLSLKKQIVETILKLAQDPKNPDLKSHKVHNFWSSSVNGDVRIVWIYSQNEVHVFELLDLGGHSGKNRVY